MSEPKYYRNGPASRVVAMRHGKVGWRVSITNAFSLTLIRFDGTPEITRMKGREAAETYARQLAQSLKLPAVRRDHHLTIPLGDWTVAPA